MKHQFKFFCLLGWLIFSLAVAQHDGVYPKMAFDSLLKEAGLPDTASMQAIILSDSVYTPNQINGKYFQIGDDHHASYKYLYIGRVNACRTSGCDENPSEEDEFEYFDYYIVFDKEKTVQAVNVFNYQAAYGEEITEEGWLKQFIGHDHTKTIRVYKDIDGISGATTSVFAITADLEYRSKMLHTIQP